VPLFWMKYRRANGSFAGAMVVESTALVIARMQATVFGLDEGLDFISGYEVGAASSEQIPASMIDRLLDERDLRRLHRILLSKKAPALWARHGMATCRASEKLRATCGRFAQSYTWQEVQDLYDITATAGNLQPHYNLAPGDPVGVVRSAANGEAELASMRWGLVPYWWKRPLKQLPATFNARAESITAKPMFRDAFNRRRCIIPATGYYGWIGRRNNKQPYFVSAADGGVLSFAGLWDRCKNPETGEPVTSCTIIVTDANALTRPIHDRMPVVLRDANIGRWLSGAGGTELLRPAAEDRLRIWQVSRRVNKTGNGDDDPTLIYKVAT
jgi:putative SOS response-associated peptidase YedK